MTPPVRSKAGATQQLSDSTVRDQLRPLIDMGAVEVATVSCRCADKVERAADRKVGRCREPPRRTPDRAGAPDRPGGPNSPPPTGLSGLVLGRRVDADALRRRLAGAAGRVASSRSWCAVERTTAPGFSPATLASWCSRPTASTSSPASHTAGPHPRAHRPHQGGSSEGQTPRRLASLLVNHRSRPPLGLL